MGRLEAAIADAADWLGAEDFRMIIDDPNLDARYRHALERLGWERHDVNVHLCYVGLPPTDRQDVTLRGVGADDAEMAEWVRRRRAGFEDADWAGQPGGDMEHEVRERRVQDQDHAEMFSVNRAGSPAGVAAWYAEPDRLVFNLAVLPEQRGFGVGAARHGQSHRASAARSALINTNEDHGPVELYERCRIVYRRR